eukprot:gene1936-2620_t
MPPKGKKGAVPAEPEPPENAHKVKFSLVVQATPKPPPPEEDTAKPAEDAEPAAVPPTIKMAMLSSFFGRDTVKTDAKPVGTEVLWEEESTIVITEKFVRDFAQINGRLDVEIKITTTAAEPLPDEEPRQVVCTMSVNCAALYDSFSVKVSMDAPFFDENALDIKAQLNPLVITFAKGSDLHVLTTLTTYKLDNEQINDPELDLLTGFHLVDGKIRLIVLEGLAAGIMQTVQRAMDMPDCPATIRQLDTLCQPVSLQYQFFHEKGDYDMPSKRVIKFGQSDIYFAGEKAPEMFRALERKHLDVRIFDRTPLAEKAVKLYVPRPDPVPDVPPDSKGKDKKGKGKKEPEPAAEAVELEPEPEPEPEPVCFGQARFSMYGFSTGQTSVKVRANVAPVTLLKGGAELDWKTRPGRYMEAGASLLLKARSALPCSPIQFVPVDPNAPPPVEATPREDGEEEEVPPPEEPYQRAIFLLQYNDSALFQELAGTLRETNAAALELKDNASGGPLAAACFGITRNAELSLRVRMTLKLPLDMNNMEYLKIVKAQRAIRHGRSHNDEYKTGLRDLYANQGSFKKADLVSWNPHKTWSPPSTEVLEFERTQRRLQARASTCLAVHTREQGPSELSQAEAMGGATGIHEKVFRWPFPKDPQQYNTHKMKPTETRIIDLQEPWEENPNFMSTFGTEDKKAKKLNLTFPHGRDLEKNPEFFQSVHLTGDGLEAEEEQARENFMQEWRSKLVVDDVLFHTVLSNEQRQKPGQLDRHHSMLHDAPKKKGYSGRSTLVPEPVSQYLQERWTEFPVSKDFHPEPRSLRQHNLHMTMPKDSVGAHIRPLSQERFLGNMTSPTKAAADFDRFTQPLPSVLLKRQHLPTKLPVPRAVGTADFKFDY